MKALLAILMLSAVLFSCGNEEVKDDPGLPKENPGQEGGDLRSRAVRHVEAQLNIAGTERYGLSIIKQHLDGDDQEDAIITVNRFTVMIASSLSSPSKFCLIIDKP